MWRFRLFLLPLGAVFELLLLVVGWVLAVAKPDIAIRLIGWATRTLPTLNWYFGD
jgi:hypothetical protein